MNKSVTLQSGAKLEITVSPFAISRSLYQAVLEAVKDLELDPKAEVDVNFFKDLFCVGLSSKKIESCLNECMKRVTYNGLKITDETWEPIEAREDYLDTCFEVAKENLLPFTKSLYAKYAPIVEMLRKNLA